MYDTWECLGCGKWDVPTTFDRCPSCWKDRSIMPKISHSGPSNINVNPDVDVADDVTEEVAEPTQLELDLDVPATDAPETAQKDEDASLDDSKPVEPSEDKQEAAESKSASVPSALVVKTPAPAAPVVNEQRPLFKFPTN